MHKKDTTTFNYQHYLMTALDKKKTVLLPQHFERYSAIKLCNNIINVLRGSLPITGAYYDRNICSSSSRLCFRHIQIQYHKTRCFKDRRAHKAHFSRGHCPQQYYCNETVTVTYQRDWSRTFKHKQECSIGTSLYFENRRMYSPWNREHFLKATQQW
jgi:hypothetical protein